MVKICKCLGSEERQKRIVYQEEIALIIFDINKKKYKVKWGNIYR